MTRTIAGGAVVAVLLVVLALTSGFRPMGTTRAQPSEVGTETPTDAPFEIGTVMNTQSFR